MLCIHGCLEELEKIFSEDSIQAIGTTGCAKFFCLTPYNSIKWQGLDFVLIQYIEIFNINLREI